MKKNLSNTVNFIKSNFEAFVWLAGLTYLAFINPYSSNHLSFCALDLIGVDNCPGCGLGRSISMIFHGDFHSSVNTHFLGWFAVIVLSVRIVSLLNRNRKKNQNSQEVYHG